MFIGAAFTAQVSYKKLNLLCVEGCVLIYVISQITVHFRTVESCVLNKYSFSKSSPFYDRQELDSMFVAFIS